MWSGGVFNELSQDGDSQIRSYQTHLNKDCTPAQYLVVCSTGERLPCVLMLLSLHHYHKYGILYKIHLSVAASDFCRGTGMPYDIAKFKDHYTFLALEKAAESWESLAPTTSLTQHGGYHILCSFFIYTAGFGLLFSFVE